MRGSNPTPPIPAAHAAIFQTNGKPGVLEVVMDLHGAAAAQPDEGKVHMPMVVAREIVAIVLVLCALRRCTQDIRIPGFPAHDGVALLLRAQAQVKASCEDVLMPRRHTAIEVSAIDRDAARASFLCRLGT